MNSGQASIHIQDANFTSDELAAAFRGLGIRVARSEQIRRRTGRTDLYVDVDVSPGPVAAQQQEGARLLALVAAENPGWGSRSVDVHGTRAAVPGNDEDEGSAHHRDRARSRDKARGRRRIRRSVKAQLHALAVTVEPPHPGSGAVQLQRPFDAWPAG